MECGKCYGRYIYNALCMHGGNDSDSDPMTMDILFDLSEIFVYLFSLLSNDRD